MINFYGGPKGENYVVSHIFGNTQELLKDLELGGASPVDLNEIVMISYGLPGSEKYEENMKKDYSSDIIENFYFTYNPYLEYYPSVEHHFGTNGHNKLYTILDPRYEGSYNGIKNMMQSSTKNCKICEDNENGSVWIKINLTGKIKFNGKFVLNDPKLQYNLDTTGITWHLASSIEKARNEEYPEGGGKITFKVQTSGGTVNENLSNITSITEVLQSTLFNKGITIENEKDHFKYFVIDNKPEQQLYAILEIHPQTAVDFTDFIIDRSEIQFNSYNFNSCLYQKVLKDTINYDDPFMYITFQGSNFAYKFLNSSIGSSPIINFNQDISFVDSNILPSITKNTELSNSRHQIFDLKLPYPSTIKSNEDKNGNTYLQLKYQETSEKPEEEKIKEQTIYMPTLSVDVNSDGLNITFIKTNGTSEKRSITIVPYFKVENGNLFWKIKDSDDSTYKDLGAMPEGPQGDKGDKGDKGDALQVTQQFSVTVESNINNRISMVDIAKTAFEMAMNKKYIDSTDIDQNYEVIIGGINYTNSTLQIQESYIMFFTLGTENNNNFTFTYDSKIIQFSYIPVSEVGGNIKYISSTENKSLILNTSENYNPKGQIYGAEGLTAGETNRIGTKVFDIIGYSGVEGGVGYYILANVTDECYDSMSQLISNYTEADTEYRGNIKLRWSIRSQLNYDYAGEILGIQKENSKVKLYVNNFFTNEVNIGESVEEYTSGRTYNYGPRFNYCYPLGYYIDKKTSGDTSYTTNATLYICGHPEFGTKELYGQSYSFGKKNINQKELSFQMGANNQGYNKYGITIGQNNISGYGNAIFGRNINAGFAQMNISQGDYNTIGNYAKYDAQFGWNLNSNYDNQYQFGKFNKNKKNNIVEIGYGTDNANRKNIFEIDKDGKIYSNEKEVLNDYNILPQLLPETTNLISLVTQFGEKLIDVTIDSTSYGHHFHGYYQIGNKNNILQNEHIYLLMLDIYIDKSGVVPDGQIGTDSNTFCELLFEPNRSTDKLHFGKTFVGSYEKFSKISKQTKYTIFYPFKYTSEITQYGIGFMEPGFNITYTYKNPRLYELYDLSNMDTENNKAKLSNYDLKSESFINIFAESLLQSKDSTIMNGIQNNIITFTQDTSFENLFGDGKNYLYNYSNEGYYIYEESNISRLKHLSYDTTLSYSKIKDDKTISLQCNYLSHNQDVMISFNPEERISLQDYKKQKEVYESIISNSYAKTVDGAVEIHILDSKIIDTSNTTECPILIKVV